MAEENLKQKTLSGFFWRFAERCGAQGVGFIVSLVLARLIVPKMFGVVALITVFTNILQVFVDSGLGSALIQKKDADDLDFSSVFYFNFSICALLYTCMFFFAPFIDKVAYAGKYDNLTSYIRVLSLVLVISGVKNIQQAYVSRKMIFKRFFFATLGGTIMAAIVGISLAFYLPPEYRVWAIIAQNLTNKTIDTIVLWFTVKWRPKLMFSFSRLKGLWSYGWKLLCSALIEVGYNNIRQLLIGSLYTSSDLAFYNRGKQFPEIVITNINTSIDSVLFPAMSKEQDDKKRVKAMTRRSIKISSFIIWPMMMGLVAVAEPLIKLIIGTNWLDSVLFLRIFCVTFAFWPIHTANLNAIRSLGRSDIFLILEILKKVVGVTLLLSTIFISVEAMAYSLFVSSVCSQIINTYPNKKLLNYSYLEQLKDIAPCVLISVFMAAVVYLIGLININYIVLLAIQIVAGATIYFGFSALFRIDSLNYSIELIKKLYNKRIKHN